MWTVPLQPVLKGNHIFQCSIVCWTGAFLGFHVLFVQRFFSFIHKGALVKGKSLSLDPPSLCWCSLTGQLHSMYRLSLSFLRKGFKSFSPPHLCKRELVCGTGTSCYTHPGLEPLGWFTGAAWGCGLESEGSRDGLSDSHISPLTHATCWFPQPSLTTDPLCMWHPRLTLCLPMKLMGDLGPVTVSSIYHRIVTKIKGEGARYAAKNSMRKGLDGGDNITCH